MADIFREVDEDLRAEQTAEFARRYAVVVLAAIVAVAIGAGLWQWHASRVRAHLAAVSASYLEALQVADDQSPGTDPAVARRKALAMLAPAAASDADGIRPLAMLREAGIETDQGNGQASLATLGKVAADEHADRTLRELATLFSVQRRIATAGEASLEGELAAIEEPGGAWRAVAMETGGLVALQHGDVDGARRRFEVLIADDAAPRSVRQQAATVLQAIGTTGPAAIAGTAASGAGR